MTQSTSAKSSRWFALGCVLLTGGVLLHLPMLGHAHMMGNRLAGMGTNPSMLIGMALIAVGATIACTAALPRRATVGSDTVMTAYEARPETTLGRWHASLIAALIIGLIIDVMKPATLGFVLPGLAREYGIERSTAALLPLAALTGTTVGSLVWGWLADIYGRRASIVISTVLFISTSVCGAMPYFEWNLAMCFLMGASAGGMLPAVYTLLAEILPPRHRSWLLVMIGGVGLAGGYLAASLTAHWFEPVFGWRFLWLQGFPTGILLLALARFIPESPVFLAAQRRVDDLAQLEQRFGLVPAMPEPTSAEQGDQSLYLTVSLAIAALVWSFVNFGLLLWLPSNLQQGLMPDVATGLLAWSAALGLPAVIIVAWAYERTDPKWTVVGAIMLTAAGLGGLLLIPNANAASPLMIAVVACLIAGTNATIATLLPFTAENTPSATRGRVTGLIAGSSKVGGVGVQLLAIAGTSPSYGRAALYLVVPTLLSATLLARYRRSNKRL